MLKNLKRLRTDKGISQQRLAEIIGVSQQLINKYENQNVEPDISTLISLAKYFDTSVDYLIGYSDINHKLENVNRYDLNDDEADFIEKYRRLTKDERDSLKFVAENYLRYNK